MTIYDFIKKYGTHGASLVLANLSEDSFTLEEVAKDLQEALQDYAKSYDHLEQLRSKKEKS